MCFLQKEPVVVLIISRNRIIESDVPNINEAFIRPKTIIIIIENRKEYIVEINIQALNKKRKVIE